MTLSIQFEDALAAREWIRPYLQPTPLRSYEALDEEIGAGIRVLVKHENHQPTNAFKIRNAISVMTLLSEEQRRRGVVLRTTHNLAEGAGATPFAGLRLLRDRLAGRKVAVVLSGSNIDAETLRRVANGEI